MVRGVWELRLDQVRELLLTEEGLVVVLVQPVLVNSHALVAPEPDQHIGFVHELWVRLADALEDATQVPQAENVVELRRRRRHVLQYGLVQHHCGLRKFQRRLLHRSIEAQETVLQNGGINPFDALAGWEGDADARVEGHHSRVDGVAPGDGRLHSRDVLAVLDHDLFEVTAALVDEGALHQEFEECQRLLRPVGVDLGHREVVDEDSEFLALLRAENAPRALGDIVLDGALEVQAAGTRGEVDVEDGGLLGRVALQRVLQCHGFGRAALAAEEHRLVQGEETSHEPRVPRRVNGRHENLVELQTRGRVELFDLVLPGVPAAHLQIETRVEERLLRQHLARQLLDEIIELLAAPLVEDAAQRPREAEYIDVFHEVYRCVALVEHGIEKPRELDDRVGAHGRAGQVVRQGLANGISVAALEDVQDEGRNVLVVQIVQCLAQLVRLLHARPAVVVRARPEVLVVDVEHATAADRRRRRVLEVEHLEQHRAVLLQADALAVRQGQQLVVVHHGVHVLDPDGVDIAIVEDVATHWLVRRVRLVHLPEDLGEQTVGPIARRWVEHPVELVCWNGLRVQR
mmetsp:Transcript_82871/g.215917  ORF Transcript_82871/g.215917 Transcript_82871/m.215917 type:complete len:574 (-) Transcript_82871:4132-5853(-)